MIENHNTVIADTDRLGITNVNKKQKEYVYFTFIFALLLFDQRLPSLIVQLSLDLDLLFDS